MPARNSVDDVRFLEISDLSKRFGTVDVLGPITTSVARGEFVALLGPSGCGKSTLLSLIAGVEQPTAGRIDLAVSPERSPSEVRTLVFQSDALLPWRTVTNNVALGLEYRNTRRDLAVQRVGATLARVGLSGFEGHYPHQLSGGMRQRVALARALVMDPEVLLLDEPFGALDAITRLRLQHDLLQLWQSTRRTVLLVTHDVDEALYLADRAVVLSARPGTVVLDRPIDLTRPRRVDADGYAELRAELLDALDLHW